MARDRRIMKKGYLSEYFFGAGSKILTRVDATSKSNQHEVGDKESGEVLKRILGTQERKAGNRFVAKYIWLLDEQESISEDGFLSWYDTRANQLHRSAEWRLYYQSNAITDLMNEGDRLFVARRHNDTVLFIVAPDDSAIANQLLWLFGIDAQSGFDFDAQNFVGDDDTFIDFATRFILDEIGIEFEDPNANTLDTIIERYGFKFPATKDFSDLARLTLPDVDARNDPDEALVAWLDREEAMFRRLENRIVARDIERGWIVDGTVNVDAFVKYSLGVQNRRKARMGRAFENHLQAVFDALELRYDAQIITENGKKPDFIFPGRTEYEDSDFPPRLLTMLAAKSTCKDRWPQVLPEAGRIIVKHLITLEPSISESQTHTMRNANVQLIVPSRIRGSYTNSQQSWLLSLGEFVEHVAEQQWAIEKTIFK